MAETKIIESLNEMKVPIDSVSLDPNNVRKHDESQLSKLKGALSIYGQVSPIVVQRSTNVIRKGNATWQAAKELGWAEIAVVYVDMDDTTARAYAIADNRLSELSEWDMEGLSDSLKLLDEADYDLGSLGWDGDELLVLKDWKPEVLEVVEDDVPALAEKAVSQLGDLWLLGGHRVLCGDATKAEDIARVLCGNSPVAMLTDPPYGMGDKRIRDGCDSSKPNQAEDWDKEPFDIALLPIHKFKTLIWGAQHYGSAPRRFGLMTWSCWDKRTRDMGDVRHGALELCCANFGKSKVWPIMWGPYQSMRQGVEHPTAKPVELIAETIQLATDRGEGVFDPFLGSGTTLIAAEQFGRKCYGLEIECRYVDVIVKRWQEFTKRDATLEGTGETFAAVAAMRSEP